MTITNPKLSDRIRPDVEAAPWVLAEIEKLEQQLTETEEFCKGEMARSRERSSRLRQQLAAKQAEVDALMLEYCPSEMSQEQLNNWAAHQRPAERDEQAEVFRVEVESLRQHLIGSNTLIQTYREATTSLRQQVTLLRDELFAVLVQDMSRDSAIAKIEALDATADLDGLILCEKEPAAWKTVEMLYPPITEEQRRSSDVPLYRAWGPKP